MGDYRCESIPYIGKWRSLLDQPLAENVLLIVNAIAMSEWRRTNSPLQLHSEGFPRRSRLGLRCKGPSEVYSSHFVRRKQGWLLRGQDKGFNAFTVVSHVSLPPLQP